MNSQTTYTPLLFLNLDSSYFKSQPLLIKIVHLNSAKKYDNNYSKLDLLHLFMNGKVEKKGKVAMAAENGSFRVRRLT